MKVGVRLGSISTVGAGVGVGIGVGVGMLSKNNLTPRSAAPGITVPIRAAAAMNKMLSK